MTPMPIFISIVCVVRQQATDLQSILNEMTREVAPLVSDYELIMVDNASSDASISTLKKLTQENGLPNIQVYALTKEVDLDTASWVGVENALGDFVVIIDPLLDDISFLPDMLEKAAEGADIVLARNEKKPKQSLMYRCANGIFNKLYQWFNGAHLAKDASQFRILSKSVINFILQHPQPSMTYRHIPITGGFSKVNLSYSATPKSTRKKVLWDSIDRGIRTLVSTTRTPMRLVTSLSIFGAFSNLLYSVYIILIFLTKTNVAAGWVSLSLQQSGMFFLISLVLFVLGEYILNMASVSNEGPLYHVGQELTSSRMTRREKLNIEVTGSQIESNKSKQPNELFHNV